MDKELLSALETLIKGIPELKESLSSYDVQVLAKKGEIQRLKKSVDVLAEQKDALISENGELNKTLVASRSEFNAEYSKKTIELDNREKELTHKEESFRLSVDDAKKLEDKRELELTAKSTGLDTLKENLDKHEADLSNREESLQTRLDSVIGRESSLLTRESELGDRESRLDDRDRNISKLESDLSDESHRIDEEKRLINNANVEIESTKQKLAEELRKVYAEKQGIPITLRALNERSKDVERRERRIKDRELMYGKR